MTYPIEIVHIHDRCLKQFEVGKFYFSDKIVVSDQWEHHREAAILDSKLAAHGLAWFGVATGVLLSPPLADAVWLFFSSCVSLSSSLLLPFGFVHSPLRLRVLALLISISSRWIVFSDYAGLDVIASSVFPPLRCVAKKRRKHSTIELEKKAVILKLIEGCRTQMKA